MGQNRKLKTTETTLSKGKKETLLGSNTVDLITYQGRRYEELFLRVVINVCSLFRLVLQSKQAHPFVLPYIQYRNYLWMHYTYCRASILIFMSTWKRKVVTEKLLIIASSEKQAWFCIRFWCTHLLFLFLFRCILSCTNWNKKAISIPVGCVSTAP